MTNYSNKNIENIKKIQRLVRLKQKPPKGPRNLPVNVQKKILNLLPLRNQKSFINVLRNNSGNTFTKNYRKRKFLASKRINMFSNKVMNQIKNQQTTILINLQNRRLRYLRDNIWRYAWPQNIRGYPFSKTRGVYFVIDGTQVYTRNGNFVGYLSVKLLPYFNIIKSWSL